MIAYIVSKWIHCKQFINSLIMEAGSANTGRPTSEEVPCKRLCLDIAGEISGSSSTSSVTSASSGGTSSVDWNQLPAVVLVELFSYLNDKDRANASRTCKQWNEQFKNPALWRRRYFRFGGTRHYRKEHARAVGFSTSLGSYVQYLQIYCDHPSYSICKRFQKTMATVLWQLTRSRCKLLDFSLSGLCAERYWRQEWPRTRLLSSLSRFLQRQTRLQVLDMSEALLDIRDGVRLLETAAIGSGSTLRALNMEDFFHIRQAIFRDPLYLTSIEQFTNLVQLYTNYSCISEGVLELLGSSCAGKLCNISIKVYRHDHRQHHISNLAWKNLAKACPRLNVSMYFEGIGKYEDIASIAVSAVPLKTLQIWSGLHSQDEDWRLGTLMAYLGNSFGHILEEASLGLETGEESIDEGLLHMLGKCKQLLYLDIQCAVLVETMAEVYRLQEQYKIGLFRCFICAENLTGVDIQHLEEVNAQYADMVDERGLDFNMRVNEYGLF